MSDATRSLLAFLLAAFLAGCGGDKPLRFEAGPLGAVEVGPADAVQVRSMLPLPGLQDVSESIRKAIELAIEDFGPIHGRTVSLGQPVDTMCSREGGEEGARRIVADPQVAGVIGPACSEASVGASPVLSAAGLVTISPASASPGLTSDLAGNPGPDYHPGFYRVYSNGLYQARAVARFAHGELGLRRMATVHDGDSFTHGLATSFANAFAALGGEVVAIASVGKGDTDMSAVLEDLADSGPDGIFLPLFAAEAAHLVRQLRELVALRGATLIAGSAAGTSEFLGSPPSEGVYLSGHDSDFGSNVNEVTGKNAAALAAAYEAATDANFFFHAYDAATLLLKAIESTAVEEGGVLHMDRAALREEIGAAAGFQGIIGKLSCDEFGDCGTGRVNIYFHADSSITDVAQLPVVYRYEP